MDTNGVSSLDQQHQAHAMAMECECFESSSLSESSVNSEVENTFDEADDEQSDFYEVMAKTSHSSSSSTSKHTSTKHTRHSIAVPKNPFAITASGSSTPSGSYNDVKLNSAIWKRRRRNQWP